MIVGLDNTEIITNPQQHQHQLSHHPRLKTGDPASLPYYDEKT